MQRSLAFAIAWLGGLWLSRTSTSILREAQQLTTHRRRAPKQLHPPVALILQSSLDIRAAEQWSAQLKCEPIFKCKEWDFRGDWNSRPIDTFHDGPADHIRRFWHCRMISKRALRQVIERKYMWWLRSRYYKDPACCPFQMKEILKSKFLLNRALKYLSFQNFIRRFRG